VFSITNDCCTEGGIAALGKKMATVSEHHFQSFYSFSSPFEKKLKTTLSDLVPASPEPSTATPRDLDRRNSRIAENWVPDRLRPALTGRYADDVVWQQVQQSHGSDFFLPIHQLVSGELDARCKTYCLSNRSQQLFSKGRLYSKETPAEDQFRHRLAIVLSREAEKRLGAVLDTSHSRLQGYSRTRPDTEPKRQFIVPIKIEDILLYHFSTNRIVCQLTFSADLPDDIPMSTELLSEITDHAGRFARLAWVEMQPSIKQQETNEQIILEMKGFSLGSLVAKLIYGPVARSQASYRTFTHVFARFAGADSVQSKSDLEKLGTLLARQYNSDYAISFKDETAQIVSDFENVMHFATLEGAASLVDCRHDGKELSFLSEYYTKAIKHTYLPLIVLNLHQLSQALDINTRSVLETTDPEDIDALEKFEPDDMKHFGELLKSWTVLQDKLAILNTRFRFRFVSRVSMHNTFNSALRDSFKLDEIEDQLSKDITEMASRVQTAVLLKNQARRQKFDRWFRWAASGTTGFAVGFFFLELVSMISGFYRDGFGILDLIVIGMSVLLVVAVAFWTYFQSKFSLPNDQP
jgi:hypothetical protein